jgi:hypothetical protein
VLFTAARAWAGEYSNEETLTTARELAQKLGMPPEKRGRLEERLLTALGSYRFAVRYGGRGIQGVFAYQLGEGGLIVKVKKGKGLLRWKGEAREHALALSSVTVGAQIGGSSEWGFGLVVGLSEPGGFGGDYSGSTVSATFATAGTGVTELSRKRYGAPPHKVYLLGSASGASANAGGGQLTLTPLNEVGR